mgnify:CR=1 FL=1
MDVSKVIGSLSVPAKSQQKSTGKTGSFEEILNNTIDDPKATDRAHQPASPAAASLLPAQSSGVGPVQGETLNHANKVLDLLDTYANALGDPKRTLKSIEPILQQLQEEVNRLPSGASPKNEGLGKVLNDIAVTANIEAIKFHRGDYVS